MTFPYIWQSVDEKEEQAHQIIERAEESNDSNDSDWVSLANKARLLLDEAKQLRADIIKAEEDAAWLEFKKEQKIQDKELYDQYHEERP